MNKKILSALIYTVVSVFILTACNTQNDNQELAEPRDVNYEPVRFGPNENQGTENLKRNEIPFNLNRNTDGNTEIDPNINRDYLPQTGNQNQENNANSIQRNQNQNQTQGFVQEVIDLTNKEREKNGLSSLKSDSELSNVAQVKSEDMVNKDYFSHTSPTYGSPFEMMENFGIEYSTAAENIAAGQNSPEAVVNAWMKSSGHRKNILNKQVTHIGVGISQDQSQGIYWTQMFIAK
ncbi:putative YkwD family protein [Bacillus pakistanensis]|uniref:YkwD family protein n=1 Tax=Rossellomorea pakistanensis TaxID=992288 RepID=A0ABS2NFH6_9BACI|nr:CAP domain-containing protein [Bacillus pakistanensis]MBM7586587.1 putative YkwD family protein [Bacillus pakistanensis]